MTTHHHTYRPDIETSSEAYAQRFSGAVGEFFLQKQSSLFIKCLPSGKRLKILEIGGGHGQLTEKILEAGHEVVVHGSSYLCFTRLGNLLARYPDQLSCVESDLDALPFSEQSFDVVSAFRLLPHISSTEDFLANICAIAKEQIIFDYAPLAGLNFFTPLLFPIKKLIEKNTRQYFCHTEGKLREILKRFDFAVEKSHGQFVIPMGIHRAMQNVPLSEKLEVLMEKFSLTDSIGAPRIINAHRISRR